MRWNIDIDVPKSDVSIWFLGQAGYYIKSGDISILIDPYLSDSAGRNNQLFSRLYPIPIAPSEIRADIFIATHNHADHLDPETINAYSYKNQTTFVAPRFAAKKLKQMGIPIVLTVDSGDSVDLGGVRVSGVFALPTSKDVLDTAGYLLTFANGKSIYHTSDTAFCELLLKACPKADVLLTCINGKFGNLGIAEAVKLTNAVQPLYVIPNHYDVMALNSENPESFRYFYSQSGGSAECIILSIYEYFQW